MNTAPPPPAPSARSRLAALAAAVCLLTAGCSATGPDDAAGDARDAGSGRARVALVTHGGDGDAFWDLVRKGAEAAAAKDGIDLTYAGDADPAGQAELIRDAVGDGVDGLAVTLAKPGAMKGPVAEAREAGIPVVGLNSGMDAWRSAGLLEYFGQDEGVAGRAVGDKLDALGAEHTLCVIHERGNVALEARCAGVKKTFGGLTEMLYVEGTDMAAVRDAVAARLRQDTRIDEVVTNGARYALTAVRSVRDAGSGARVATFDLDKDLVAAVKRGDVQFAVDQQPYLQGYLAVDALWLYRTNGNVSGGGTQPVLTGPAFVTKANADAVGRFAAKGTR
ncbi:substrate-binding domain-containing protein [Streptomyces griseoviridis]|jgi:simple sugar transport system substrate-binding protein|uniref:Simple sugar transport system substrate-binding protein n=3 Tax=Streptomyces TaxID=1883 RepID=A0ABT9LMK0_STRGD|nr:MULTISPECIES: substrate-binding domain-containing protein [Streptomyces]MDP9684771.1 simple sugar transport system substrate-binding protein [Streptomyces griseoviridis]GGS44724.1 sugar ABC transporter substrate-binding protein [Streptomyces niveoruber]GGT07512.1 sugar ABC transporter substrate-binding protein [Streptomyces griseoviridis]GGU47523.1 sugar ABC transporter substrate-binding protein [Streptomyces daghestanicus]GHI30271.1 sugar ABC transporter substrate-binding protein [Streptom